MTSGTTVRNTTSVTVLTMPTAMMNTRMIAFTRLGLRML